MGSRSLLLCLCWLAVLGVVVSFAPSAVQHKHISKVSTTSSSWKPSTFLPSTASLFSKTSLHFFRRGNGEEAKDESKQDDGDDSDGKNATSSGPISRLMQRVTKKADPEPESKSEISATEKAQALRTQAMRARLEAEKLDAILTLEKITRLEGEIKEAARNNESTEELAKQIQFLQSRLNQESNSTAIPSLSSTPVVASTVVSPPSVSTMESDVEERAAKIPFSQEDFDIALELYKNTPDVLKVQLAQLAGMDVKQVNDINATDYAIRMEKMRRFDYSFLEGIDPPAITPQQIEEKKKSPTFALKKGLMERKLRSMSDDEIARCFLEDEYFTMQLSKPYEDRIREREDVAKRLPKEAIDSKAFLDELSPLKFPMSKNLPSTTRPQLEGVFPKWIEKLEKPTQAQVDAFCANVIPNLPNKGFQLSGKPQEVTAGYMVPGVNKFKDGNTLIDSIDRELAKNPLLKDKITVIYTPDYTMSEGFEKLETFDRKLAQSDMTNLPGLSEFPDMSMFEARPALFILGPSVSRPPQRVLLSGVTLIGLFTSFYVSITPFLFNPAYLERAQNDIDMTTQTFQPNMSWLIDLSTPLFVGLVATQVAHELGHVIMSKKYSVKMGIPTIVPSPVTGITNLITSFRSSPKDSNELFDIAFAGPAAGLIVSLLMLYAGLALTGISEGQATALFPCLPVQILRQSSLAGAMIEAVLGNSILYIPPGIAPEVASKMTLSLHPIAIAGFIGMFVNAFSFLPVGLTDGGRISQAITGRVNKGLVGGLAIVGLFLSGFFGGNDLFLFYFLFLTLVQTGQDIPLRNEVDNDVSLSRVGAALVAGVVALLCIIPMD